MKTRLLVLGFAALSLSTAPATAALAIFGDGGDELQGALNDITVGGVSSVDVRTDALSESDDPYWGIDGSGGTVNTISIEHAAWNYYNSFGIYDAANPANRVQIFDGSAYVGSLALVSIWADGSVFVNFTDTYVDFAGNLFGYYLDSRNGHPDWTGGLWYSDTSLNADRMDHMHAYQGLNIDTIQIGSLSPGVWSSAEYLLAFEDLHLMHWGNQDDITVRPPEWGDTEPNFSDFVVMVDSVPVPVPGAVLLGLLGLGAAGLKLRKHA